MPILSRIVMRSVPQFLRANKANNIDGLGSGGYYWSGEEKVLHSSKAHVFDNLIPLTKRTSFAEGILEPTPLS